MLKDTKAETTMTPEERAQKLVSDSKNYVVKAINLLFEPIDILEDKIIFPLKQEDISNIAKSINLLEIAHDNMNVACSICNWNKDICYQIDDACRKLGVCLANILASENTDDLYPEYDGKEGLAILGKVLASLVRWNDEEQA